MHGFDRPSAGTWRRASESEREQLPESPQRSSWLCNPLNKTATTEKKKVAPCIAPCPKEAAEPNVARSEFPLVDAGVLPHTLHLISVKLAGAQREQSSVNSYSSRWFTSRHHLTVTTKWNQNSKLSNPTICHHVILIRCILRVFYAVREPTYRWDPLTQISVFVH